MLMHNFLYTHVHTHEHTYVYALFSVKKQSSILLKYNYNWVVKITNTGNRFSNHPRAVWTKVSDRLIDAILRDMRS